jgi:hypothetical protein
MRKLYILILLHVFLLSGIGKSSFAQQETEKVRKNTIRVNVSNPAIFGSKALIFGYERVLNDHHSITIDVGGMSLPKLLPGNITINDSIQLSANSTQSGYHVSVEYRFYLPNENKHNAPRGVYLAPFVSYNKFTRNNTWDLNTTSFKGDLSTEFKLTISTIGGELGYQFILWKRLAIDLVLIGPGISSYKIKTNLSTSLSADDQAELFRKINDALADKIPGYSLVIDDQEYEKNGSTNTTTIGFRYMVHLGFRF